MSTWVVPWVLTFGCAAVLFVGQRYHTRARYPSSLPLPPGPPGLPWIGNVIGINTTMPWLTYTDWSKRYGGLIYSRLLGKDIIIINSEKVAKELLENRSGNYSDRPYLITNELCGIGFNSVMLRYGDRWRLHRRLFHQTFRADMMPRFMPIQHHKTCLLLRRILDAPEQLSEHVFEYTASVILNSVYDYDPLFQKDKLLIVLANVLETAVSAVTPGVAIVVSTFSVLLNLPSWFPGMSFKRKMEAARELSGTYVEEPFTYSLQKTPNGNIVPSMVHSALQNMEQKGVSPDESWMNALKEAAATAFLAASETSHSVVMTFFFLMMANPGIQEKAQAQIDTIVGRTRLPAADDRPSLPYVDAIFREILRYSPPIPLSVPHAVLADDVFAGFHIPKGGRFEASLYEVRADTNIQGAIVLANLWSMTHDEAKFPNPHLFLPERFLNDDGSLKPNDTENISFGFGRRICVGRHFADASIWSLMVKFLAVFRILKPLDENGAEIPVEPKFSGGPGVLHPLPFPCRIVPRIPGMDTNMLEELINASSE